MGRSQKEKLKKLNQAFEISCQRALKQLDEKNRWKNLYGQMIRELEKANKVTDAIIITVLKDYTPDGCIRLPVAKTAITEEYELEYIPETEKAENGTLKRTGTVIKLKKIEKQAEDD